MSWQQTGKTGQFEDWDASQKDLTKEGFFELDWLEEEEKEYWEAKEHKYISELTVDVLINVAPAKGSLRRQKVMENETQEEKESNLHTMFNLMLSKKRLLSSKKRSFGVLNMGCLLSVFWVLKKSLWCMLEKMIWRKETHSVPWGHLRFRSLSQNKIGMRSSRKF